MRIPPPLLLVALWIATLPVAAQRAADFAPNARVDVRARAAVRFGDERTTGHTSAVVEMLLAAAKKPRTVGDDAERCVALAALDGLIRADARPTEKEALALARLGSLYAPGVARLLAADAKRYATALATLIDRKDVAPRLLRAVCARLLDTPDRRALTTSLLRNLHPRASVLVVQPGSLAGGGGFGHSHGSGRLRVPSDFPAIGLWQLARRDADSPDRDLRAIVTREVVEPGRTRAFGRTIRRGAESDERRVRISALAAVLGMDRGDIAHAVIGSARIEFSDADAYRRAITSLRADYAGRYRKLVDAARAKGLLTDKTAKSLVPRVTLDVNDLREDKTPPLPSTKDKPAAAPAKTVRIGGIDWRTDYDAALATARAAGKPLWLHFGENPG